jgi:POT family proton-dependent oligopeptide transporter
MVGQLYPPGDPRRDGAFSIFYMGINLGAFLCPFVCGTLGEKVGWHWGFGSAAVGMLLGLLLYVWGKPRLLKGIGDRPAGGPGKPATAPLFFIASCVISAGFGLAYHFGAIGAVGELIKMLTERPWLGWSVVGMLITAVLGWIGWFLWINRPEDRMPVVTIFVYIAFNALFWMAFEQAGSSMTLYTDKYTDTTLMGKEVPTTWFQSLNPMFIFILAPIFSILWTQLAKRKVNVPQPAKIALGLIFLGLGFAVLVYGANTVKAGVAQAAVNGVVPPVMKAAMFYLVLTYFLHTVGEICLSPTGLSYVTKAAPVKFVSLLMGIWFVSSFVANLGGGLIAAQVKDIEEGKVKLPWSFGGQADFFMLFVVSSIGAGVLILALTPILIRWQRSRED